jgi:hypothetical protein
MPGFPSLSTYTQQALLNHLFGKAAFTAPTIYVALFTANGVDAGTGFTEAAYTGYVRKSTAAADWASATAATPSVTANANAVTFAACTGGTSAVVGFGLYDAASAGNYLGGGTCSLSVSNGITPSFAAGQLQATLD